MNLEHRFHQYPLCCFGTSCSRSDPPVNSTLDRKCSDNEGKPGKRGFGEHLKHNSFPTKEKCIELCSTDPRCNWWSYGVKGQLKTECRTYDRFPGTLDENEDWLSGNCAPDDHFEDLPYGCKIC